jgi:quercetin dioxygenase-like cupin family protein
MGSPADARGLNSDPTNTRAWLWRVLSHVRIFTIASGYEIEKEAAFLITTRLSHALPMPAENASQPGPTRRHQMKLDLNARRLFLSAAVALAAFTAIPAGHAFAGECPADQVAENGMEPGEMMPKKVTDEVLSSIDLSPKGGDWKNTALRMRKLVVQPGGVVPWHAHDMRPANILIVSGQITEYRSTCKVPILHKAGDVTAEFGHLSHWWKNNGKKPAVLYSADILTQDMPADESM